jgi:hypothetical protein
VSVPAPLCMTAVGDRSMSELKTVMLAVRLPPVESRESVVAQLRTIELASVTFSVATSFGAV